MEKHFAVIGDPIEHSYSPGMHNAGYRQLGINALYHRFQVRPAELAEAVRGLSALGFSGWNVTIPHKEKIIPYLDSLTPEATCAGAVNTVKVFEGRLLGHNTDGEGFIRSLASEIPDFKDLRGKKAVLLGAGGAAKGIALCLAKRGAFIHILNRTPEKAADLLRIVEQQGGKGSWGEFAPGGWLEDVDLLVQTTPLGLQGEPFPMSLKGLSPRAVAVDIIVRAWETGFLQAAREQGCRVKDGAGMLLYQGALAWEFWFDGEAPIAGMLKGLRSQLSSANS